MNWKPPATDGMYCPLWRKPTAKVCHTCALWVPIQGTHPQTGEPCNSWYCSFNAAVLTSIDAARASREGAATTQELRNDMHADRQGAARVVAIAPLGNGTGALRLSDNRPSATDRDNSQA